MPAAEPADPVFVLCTARSGSTLVRFMLDAHPDLACPPEIRLPWLCRQLAGAWSVLEDAPADAGDPEKPVTYSDAVVNGLRVSLNPMIGSYLSRRGKKRFCDKSLGGAAHADLLLQVWPGSKFICLYRHPMDVIASGLEASPWGLTSYGFENYASGSSNTVAALARYWADYTEAIAETEEEFGTQCLRVRYEDLVTNPDHETARIFEFLEVSPQPGIAARSLDAPQQRFGPGDYKIWSIPEVTASSVGRGWSVPSRLIATSVLTRLNDLADRLGYVKVDENWGTGSMPAEVRASEDSRTAGALLLAGRLAAGMGRCDSAPAESAPAESAPAESAPAESALLFVSGGHGKTDTWWHLDFVAGALSAGSGSRALDADWSVTGSALAWEHVLAGAANLGVAFRRGELRYAGRDGHPAGSAVADARVARLASLLGISGA
ncbi:MAG TPA: sulfotransferase [Streptosporangiaceae bacterium]|nr:sulfotransferase [Streptosporangiaceae bacterium]